MRRALLILVTLSVLLGGLRLLSACLEITPIIVTREASRADAGCLTCLELPQNCASIIDRCQRDPRCIPAFACIVRESCLDLPTLDDKINCGLPCAADAGIQSVNDPIITDYLVGLVACGQQKCVSECNLADSGAGL